jgi:hypothetical protein
LLRNVKLKVVGAVFSEQASSPRQGRILYENCSRFLCIAKT